MKKKLLALPLILFCLNVYAQNEQEPRLDVIIKKTLDYERPARLLEEDNKKGILFRFTPGLEIITDIDAVKVYIFDSESGRTPYENNDINSGYVRIKLEKPGFQDFSFWVNIKENYRTTVYVFYNEHNQAGSSDSKVPAERKSVLLYHEINPDDPEYYRQLYFMNSADSESFESSAIMQDDSGSILTLSPHPVQGGNVFIWDGTDAQGHDVSDGEYGFRLYGEQDYKIRLDRKYSRQALNYFSGYSGMALVPAARVLFKKGFQFGSTFSIESLYNANDYNLPFSFFMRLSPLKRWEAGLEAETAFITESGRPSLRVNTSQKVFLFDIDSVQVSMGMRGSYKSAINDFSDKIDENIIRDPSGVSLFIPLQYTIEGWDFLGSPEIYYTLQPLSSNIESENYDFTAALRWGVMHSSGKLFSAGLSSVLFFPSYRGNPVSMQAGVEGTFYVPTTPLYLNFYGILQKVRGHGDGTILGINMGFVL